MGPKGLDYPFAQAQLTILLSAARIRNGEGVRHITAVPPFAGADDDS
jgi:hypothetical protein